MIPAVLFVAGLLLIVAGVVLIYLPAGLIVAGVLSSGSVALWVRGRRRRSP